MNSKFWNKKTRFCALKNFNFTYSCLYATPIKVENLLSSSFVTFNLENVNLLSSFNINPKNGLAYKKTCSEPQILEAIQNAFVLTYPCEIYS